KHVMSNREDRNVIHLIKYVSPFCKQSINRARIFETASQGLYRAFARNMDRRQHFLEYEGVRQSECRYANDFHIVRGRRLLSAHASSSSSSSSSTVPSGRPRIFRRTSGVALLSRRSCAESSILERSSCTAASKTSSFIIPSYALLSIAESSFVLPEFHSPSLA